MDLDYYFNIFQPDLVVFEVAEYTFSDDFFDHDRMAALDYNPGLYKKGDNFEETRERILLQASKISDDLTIQAEVIPSKGFDEVVVNTSLHDARYVWLITDNAVYDLFKNEHGFYEVAVPKNDINKDVILYYENNNGSRYFAKVEVSNTIEMLETADYTSGVTIEPGNNRITIPSTSLGCLLIWWKPINSDTIMRRIHMRFLL